MKDLQLYLFMKDLSQHKQQFIILQVHKNLQLCLFAD